MRYHRSPAERPRQAKRFLTVRDVEDLAAEGGTEIVHSDDLVITDAAREAAHDLDIRILSEADLERAAATEKRKAEPVAAASQPVSQPMAPIVASSGSAVVSAMPPVAVSARSVASPPASSPAQAVARPKLDDAFVRAIVQAVRRSWQPVVRHPRRLLPSRSGS